MAYKKRRSEALLATATTVLPAIGLGAKYGQVRGFRARNYASSAKAAGGADLLLGVEIKDNNGDILYLDAADRDYAAAEVTKNIAFDETQTGLGVSTVDATGAVLVATQGETADAPVVEGPITVTVRNAGTATDFFSIDLMVEV